MIIIISLLLLIYSIYNIVKWKLDSNNTNKQIEEVQETVKVEEVIDTEIVLPEEEIPKSNPYWDYIKMNMIDINFNELKNINNDVKGWIKVNGTYPFVQYNNNKYYLTHSFDKSYNSAGWLFLDYRNNNKNTIIYTHGRNDKLIKKEQK